jgi:hypothetical protein
MEPKRRTPTSNACNMGFILAKPFMTCDHALGFSHMPMSQCSANEGSKNNNHKHVKRGSSEKTTEHTLMRRPRGTKIYLEK